MDALPEHSASKHGTKAHTRLKSAKLYLCTDARREKGDLTEFVRRAVDGGVDIVQLRDKKSAGERQYGQLTTQQELDYLGIIADAAHSLGALVAVNDRADIARAAGADVFHIGQDDLPVGHARAIVGPDVVIGISTHTPQQADDANLDPNVDYFCTGPVWATPTKPGRPAVGLTLIAHAAKTATKPWFAIGGIDATTVHEVAGEGARRIVVVRAITDADDPAHAARSLTAALTLRGDTPE